MASRPGSEWRRFFSVSASEWLRSPSRGIVRAWGVVPVMARNMLSRNPFITERTKINVVTPNITPKTENQVTAVMESVLRGARRNLRPMKEASRKEAAQEAARVSPDGARGKRRINSEKEVPSSMSLSLS